MFDSSDHSAEWIVYDKSQENSHLQVLERCTPVTSASICLFAGTIKLGEDKIVPADEPSGRVKLQLGKNVNMVLEAKVSIFVQPPQSPVKLKSPFFVLKACEALMRLRKKWNAMLLSFLKQTGQSKNLASHEVRFTTKGSYFGTGDILTLICWQLNTQGALAQLMKVTKEKEGSVSLQLSREEDMIPCVFLSPSDDAGRLKRLDCDGQDDPSKYDQVLCLSNGPPCKVRNIKFLWRTVHQD